MSIGFRMLESWCSKVEKNFSALKLGCQLEHSLMHCIPFKFIAPLSGM